MAKRQTRVTHADGTVSTRTSRTRVYTHAVEVGPADPNKYADYLERKAAEHEDRAARDAAAAESGSVTIRDRGLGPMNQNYYTHDTDHLYTHEAKLAGTNLFTWCSADGRTLTYPNAGSEGEVVEVDGYLRKYARSSVAEHTERAAQLRDEAAKVRAAGTPVFGYGIVRWSSSERAARAALGQFAYAAERGSVVRVVPVDAEQAAR